MTYQVSVQTYVTVGYYTNLRLYAVLETYRGLSPSKILKVSNQLT